MRWEQCVYLDKPEKLEPPNFPLPFGSRLSNNFTVRNIALIIDNR